MAKRKLFSLRLKESEPAEPQPIPYKIVIQQPAKVDKANEKRSIQTERQIQENHKTACKGGKAKGYAYRWWTARRYDKKTEVNS